MANENTNLRRRFPTIMKWILAGLLSSVVACGLMASWRTRHQPVPENIAATNSLAERASCRLVLTSLNGDKPIDNEIAQLQKRIVSRPVSTADLERLGWTFVEKARLTFDGGYYKLAEQCANCMESIESEGGKSPEALLLRAHVMQSLHRFSEAEETARQLIKMRQRPFDYGVLGDVLIDQGRIREGAEAYQRMVDLRPDLQSYARAAHVRWLTGDLRGALSLMKLACDSSSPNDPESAAWAFTRLSLYELQQGATEQALQSCDAALNLQPDYAPAIFARARVLLASNSPSQAVAEFQRAANLNPLPEYQWALADALRSIGDLAAASQVESDLTKGADDPRALSLYLATRGEKVDLALQLANKELGNRQDAFTHDALAWALTAAGRTAEAQEHMKQALSEGTHDARLFFHAGVIAALNNQKQQATLWLKKAHATEQMLLPSEQLQLEEWRKKIVTSKGSNQRRYVRHQPTNIF